MWTTQSAPSGKRVMMFLLLLSQSLAMLGDWGCLKRRKTTTITNKYQENQSEQPVHQERTQPDREIFNMNLEPSLGSSDEKTGQAPRKRKREDETDQIAEGLKKQLEEQKETTQQKIQELSRSYTKLNEYQAKRDKLEHELRVEKQKNQRIQQEHEDLLMEAQAQSRPAVALTRKSETVTVEPKELESLQQELKTLRRQVQEKEKEKRIAIRRSQSENLANRQTEAAKHDEDVLELKVQIRNQERQHAKTLAENEETLTYLQEDLQAAKAERDRLSELRRTSRVRVSLEEEPASHQKALQQKEDEMDQLKHEKAAMQKELDQLKHEKATMQKELDEVSREKEQMAERMAEFEQLADAVRQGVLQISPATSKDELSPNRSDASP